MRSLTSIPELPSRAEALSEGGSDYCCGSVLRSCYTERQAEEKEGEEEEEEVVWVAVLLMIEGITEAMQHCVL